MYVCLNILGETGPSLGLSNPQMARILEAANGLALLSLQKPQEHPVGKVSLSNLNSFLFLCLLLEQKRTQLPFQSGPAPPSC